ncbi:MAG: tetratricopeptide repeat protein [Halioglobus sp.]
MSTQDSGADSTADANNELWTAHMKQGQRHFQEGKMRAAAMSFKEATDSFPTRVAGWINLSSALLEAKQFDSAARVSSNAIKLNPNLMHPHMILGDALRLMGKPAAALQSYEKAVELERNPAALNKLACVLRGKSKIDEAKALYLEAIELAPDFSLAKINLATLELEADEIASAKERLDSLVTQNLPFHEEYEVKMAQRALSQREHLGDAISKLVTDTDFATLEDSLRTMPGMEGPVDDEIAASLQACAASAKALATTVTAQSENNALPDEWPRIEALFTIPVCSSVSDYIATKASLANRETLDPQVALALQVEKAVETARLAEGKLKNAFATEVHLRHWHSLSCQQQPGIYPGHFKYTRYWVPNEPTRRRGEPALCSATLRQFLNDGLEPLPPGVARAAALLMAMSEIHLFADGNTRTSITWMNRELEWAGMLPALFPLGTGLRDQLKYAMAQVRERNGDLKPMVKVIEQGQQFTREFLQELGGGGGDRPRF